MKTEHRIRCQQVS